MLVTIHNADGSRTTYDTDYKAPVWPKTPITLTNLDAIGALAKRAGYKDWKTWGPDANCKGCYTNHLQLALERHGLIDDYSVGMKMKDALAKKNVFEVFDALKESGIEEPTFEDYDNLMLIYLHPDGTAVETDTEYAEDEEVCPFCGERMECISDNRTIDFVCEPGGCGYDPATARGSAEYRCNHCGNYEIYYA